jgi:hypothetical protein
MLAAITTLGGIFGFVTSVLTFVSRHKIIFEYIVKAWNYIKRLWQHPIFKSWIDKIFKSNDNLSENHIEKPDLANINDEDLRSALQTASNYMKSYCYKIAFRAKNDSDVYIKNLSIIKYFFVRTCNDNKDYSKINLKNSKMNYLCIKKQGINEKEKKVIVSHIANLCVLIMKKHGNDNESLKSYEIIIFNLINYLRENEINLEKNLNLFSLEHIEVLQSVLVGENQNTQLYKNNTKINLYMERFWYVINTFGYDFVKSNTDIIRCLIGNDKSYNNFLFELETQHNHVYEKYEFTSEPDLQVFARTKFWLLQNFYVSQQDKLDSIDKQKQFLNIHELVYILGLENIYLFNNKTIKLIVDNPEKVYLILSNENNKRNFIKDINKILENFANHSETQSENYNDKLKKFNDDFSKTFNSFSVNQEENNENSNSEVNLNQSNLFDKNYMNETYPGMSHNSNEFLLTIKDCLLKKFPEKSKRIYLYSKKNFSKNKRKVLGENAKQYQYFVSYYCKYCYENKNQIHLLKLVEPQFFSSIDSILRQLEETNEKISNVLFSRICFLVPKLGNKFIQNHAEYIIEILYLLKSDKYFKILEKEINGYTEEINRIQCDKTSQITPPAVRRTLLNVHAFLYSYCVKIEKEDKFEESEKLIENMNILIKNIKICAIPRVIIFLTIPVINHLIKDFMENSNNVNQNCQTETEFEKCINNPVDKLKELYYNKEINNLNETTIFRSEERGL